MRRAVSALILLFVFLTAGQARKTDTCAFRIMTCNVRITAVDEDSEDLNRRWENRRELCVNTILKRNPDVFCLQEVIYDSYDYFRKRCRKYTSYGFAGPEMDPYTEGYHFIGKNVIFFRTDKFEYVSSGSYWLSEDPLIGGSISWGTTRARHCNWVRLRDRKTGKEFRILDVHLDHLSDSARLEQMKLVLRECGQYASDFPQIICGDFNAGITSAPIRYIHSQDGWKEMYEAVNGEGEYGYTYHAFKGDNREKKGSRIDFIFYRGNIVPVSCEIIKDHSGGMYPSDHYFIEAVFR